MCEIQCIIHVKVDLQVKLADKDFEITRINMYKKIDGKNWELSPKIRICKNEEV